MYDILDAINVIKCLVKVTGDFMMKCFFCHSLHIAILQDVYPFLFPMVTYHFFINHFEYKICFKNTNQHCISISCPEINQGLHVTFILLEYFVVYLLHTYLKLFIDILDLSRK